MTNICGALIREKLINDGKVQNAYSISADESANISKKRQLSEGIGFRNHKTKSKRRIHGFCLAKKIKSQSIAPVIKTA